MEINIKEYKNNEILTSKELNDSFLVIDNSNKTLNDKKDNATKNINENILKIKELLNKIDNSISSNKYDVKIIFEDNVYKNNGIIQSSIINAFKYNWHEGVIPKNLGELNISFFDNVDYNFPSTKIYYGYPPFDSTKQYFYFRIPSLLLIYISLIYEFNFNIDQIYYCYIGDVNKNMINSQNYPFNDKIVDEFQILTLNIVDQNNSVLRYIVLEN